MPTDEPNSTPTSTTPTETPSLVGDAGKPPVEAAKPGEAVPEGEKPVVEKTEEEKAAEAKKLADDTKASPLKLEEIKLGEGVEVDPALAEDFTKVVNEHGIPRSAVQALLELQTKSMKAASETGSALWNKTQEDWRKEIQADPEIGGDKWKTHSASIGKLLDEYGTPELRGVFDLTGAGNNPHVARFMAKIAERLTEGGAVPAGLPSTGPRDPASILYPNQGK